MNGSTAQVFFPLPPSLPHSPSLSHFPPFLVGDDKRMYCFSVKTGKLEHEMDAHDSEIVGMAHHPHQNLIASYCVSGSLKLWKP